MKKQTIALYGYGYVGKAVAEFLRDHYELAIYDPGYPEFSDRTKLSGIPFAIICVPTPTADDGSCDTSIVEETIRTSNHSYYLIKSTVVPGTTDRLIKETGKKLVFSPEYIGEGRYEIPFWLDFPHPTNMKVHSFHIFGGMAEATSKWIEVWQKVAGWVPRYMQTDAKTAELTKYMANTFLATKKIFCDEFYEIAKTMGVDYNELKELWLLDGRIGRSMTLIFPDNRGFGGKCLPKDTNGIVRHSEKNGYEPKFLKQVLASNKDFRKE